MKKKMTTFVTSLVLTLSMLLGGICSIPVHAQEVDKRSSDTIEIAPRAGEETLPIGEYLIGSYFNFTDTNLTKAKTMPAGAYSFRLHIEFTRADIDKGLGQEKLRVEIRDMKGNCIAGRTVTDTSGEFSGSTYRRYTNLDLGPISVSPGQKYQIFFDASSVNPAQSNGNFRSIRILTFKSYINL